MSTSLGGTGLLFFIIPLRVGFVNDLRKSPQAIRLRASGEEKEIEKVKAGDSGYLQQNVLQDFDFLYNNHNQRQLQNSFEDNP